jgi:ribosomal-protein-alanine N-acetyltransferase
MSKAEDEQQTRLDRAREIGLFRYMLIREAADPSLSKRERGAMIRTTNAASPSATANFPNGALSPATTSTTTGPQDSPAASAPPSPHGTSTGPATQNTGSTRSKAEAHPPSYGYRNAGRLTSGAPGRLLCYGTIIAMYPIRLTGRLVALREFRPDDVADALAINGDDRVTQWLSYDSRDEAANTAMIEGAISRAQLDPRTEYYFAVADPTDRMVGFARLGLTGHQAAKLGYAINADHWGHGYATHAARTLINYGFTELGLHRITAAIGPDNAASIAVVKRLGMQHEGRLRDHVFTNGAWRDSQIYSILAHEWTANAAQS